MIDKVERCEYLLQDLGWRTARRRDRVAFARSLKWWYTDGDVRAMWLAWCGRRRGVAPERKEVVS